MSSETDEKGKYYTDVIHKEPLRVCIRTLSSRIDGVVHFRPNKRLLDELNQGAAAFIAVTQATVLADGITAQVPFLALRKGTIEWVAPLEQEIEVGS